MALSSRNYNSSSSSSSTEMFNSSVSSSSSRILDHHFGSGLSFRDLYDQFRMWIERNVPDCRDIFTKSIQDSSSLGSAASSSAAMSSSVTADKFQVKLDVQQFAADEITIKIVQGNAITVEGRHEERRDEYGFVSRHFLRRYVLPEGYDIKNVVSNLSSDGVLSIIAPRVGHDVSEQHRKVPIRQSEFASRFFGNEGREEARSAQRQQQQQQQQSSTTLVNQRTGTDGYRIVPVRQTGLTYSKTLEQNLHESQEYQRRTNRDGYRNVPVQETGVSAETNRRREELLRTNYEFEPSPKIQEIEDKYRDVLDSMKTTEESIDQEDTEIRERRRMQGGNEDGAVRQTYEETRREEEFVSSETGDGRQVPVGAPQPSQSHDGFASSKTSDSRRQLHGTQTDAESAGRAVPPVTSVKIKEFTEQTITQNSAHSDGRRTVPVQQSTESSVREEFYSSSGTDRGCTDGARTTSEAYGEEQRSSHQSRKEDASAPPVHQTGMTSSSTSKFSEYEEQRTSQRQTGPVAPVQQHQSTKSFEETKERQEYSATSSSSSQQQQQQQQRRYTGNLSSSSTVLSEEGTSSQKIVPASHHRQQQQQQQQRINQSDFTCRRESVSSCTENGLTSEVSEYQKQELSQQNGLASKSNEYKKEESVRRTGQPSPLASKCTENREREVRCVIQEVTEGVDSVPVEYMRTSSQASNAADGNRERIVPVEIL